jgi:hypothetical protein
VASSRVNFTFTFMDSCLPTSVRIVTESRAAKGGRLHRVADLHKDKVVFRMCHCIFSFLLIYVLGYTFVNVVTHSSK